MLAGRFWADCEQTQSRKYLRQSLWHLQQVIRDPSLYGGPQLLNVSGDTISWSAASDVWIDVALFEEVFAHTQGLAANQIDEERRAAMQQAIALYDGDLLEGWYQDWCIFHRERLQNMYIAMLEQLVDYCELQREYDNALTYGNRLLQQDRARERTYTRMMRLHYLAGDRTGALRVFQRCVEALEEELSVRPSHRTLELYEQIRADRLEMHSNTAVRDPGTGSESAPLPSALPTLSKLRDLLLKIQHQVQADIKEVNQAIASQPKTSQINKDLNSAGRRATQF